MKKIFNLVIISLLFSQFLSAQNEIKVSNHLRQLNNDTLLYLKEKVIGQKNLYIGKPLDSLLKDLPTIISEYFNNDNPKNRFLCYGTSFSFFPIREIPNKISQKKQPLIIVITWSTPLNTNELSTLGLANMFAGKWTQVAHDYFKNKIVKNIEMVKYDF